MLLSGALQRAPATAQFQVRAIPALFRQTVLLRVADLAPRLARRVEITDGLLAASFAARHAVRSSGPDQLARTMSLVQYGDALSWHLADLRGVDLREAELKQLNMHRSDLRGARLPEGEYLFRRVGDGEEFLRRLVDADVGCLRRQYDGNQQFERAAIVEFGLRVGHAFAQDAKNGCAFGPVDGVGEDPLGP